MRRSGFLFIACVSLVLPTTQAGTAEDPEFTDPAADQVPPGPPGATYDLLAGWLTLDERGDVTATLRLTEVAAQSTGTFDFTWGMAGPLDPDSSAARAGVRFYLQG